MSCKIFCRSTFFSLNPDSDIQTGYAVMPQRFLCALAFTLTLATNLNPMTRDDDHHDGSKLTLPRFDPKDPTYFDNLQAYAQDRGLGWLLHANDDDTNDISKYEDMQSEKFQNLKTTGDDATDEDKKKAQRWINDSSILAGILRRSCHRNPLGSPGRRPTSSLAAAPPGP